MEEQRPNKEQNSALHKAVLYAVKSLCGNSTFWWNLLPAIGITIEFITFERSTLGYAVGCIGILNWIVVIAMFIKEIKH